MIDAMPILVPERPAFVTASERLVWEELRRQLGPDDLLAANLHMTDVERDYEIDLIVALTGGAIIVVEVKGGGVWAEDGQWKQDYKGTVSTIDPVTQAMTAKHALENWISHSPDWGSRPHVRYAHTVVMPYLAIDDGFEMPDCPRWMINGKDDLHLLSRRFHELGGHKSGHLPTLTADDVHAIAGIIKGRMLPQRDHIGEAAERADIADRLTREQAVILDAIRLLHRVEVRGGAGTGKTWLAIEQARRLTKAGQRVALICYSRGLAAWLQRRVSIFSRKGQPAYVGTFHGLGIEWGADEGSDDDSEYWESTLPAKMVKLGGELPEGQRFDAIVIDEAQDFADTWWPAVFAALKHEDDALYVFSDEGQQVFSRYGGGRPDNLVPLVLDRNLRNTKQIAQTFTEMAPIRMKGGDLEGPDVRLVSCEPAEALDRADDLVDEMLDAGWQPSDIAVLATGRRHGEQIARQAASAQSYWDSFWDDEQVFYGHVLGFKGLERNVVILAVNEGDNWPRAKERLYVGLSRARDLLIVCADPHHIETVAGPAVLRKMVE